jgi:hypothetical protein
MKIFFLFVFFFFVVTGWVMAFDCGTGGTLVVSNINAREQYFMFDSIRYYVPGTQTVQINCAGLVDTVFPVGFQYTFILGTSAYSFLDVFLQNFLLGMAGIVCGGMFVYAVLKNS